MKTTYRKSCAANLLLVSDLTLDPSFKVNVVLHTYNDLSLPRFQDIFPAMKSYLANILVQFVQLGWLLWQRI